MKYFIACVVLFLWVMNCEASPAGGKWDIIKNLSYTKEGKKITITWDLAVQAESLFVLRGKKAVAMLEGDAESWECTNHECGLFRYSVMYVWNKNILDHEDLLVDNGKVTWKKPGCQVSGYYLYLAVAEGDPYQQLPYENPEEFSYDAGLYTEVGLITLYNHYLIEGGKEYYMAASSYLWEGNDFSISHLTDPLTFKYKVITETWWP
jgi:hypothetical protein